MSENTALTEFLLGDMWLKIDVQFLLADVLIILQLPPMHLIGICFNNLDDQPICSTSRQSVSAICLFGHAFVQRDLHVICHFSTVKLQHLHRRFGHPSTEKLYPVLERTDVDSINADTRQALSKIK